MGRDLKSRFESKINRTDGCWLWTGCTHKIGYGYFKAAGKSEAAHRVAYRLYVGPIPDDKCVCHSCDVRHCVNPAHLWLGTQKENCRDMWSKGRAPDRSGDHYRDHTRPDNAERNRRVLGKLTREQVLEIRTSKERPGQLGRKFGVDPAIISHVRAGRTYKDIQP